MNISNNNQTKQNYILSCAGGVLCTGALFKINNMAAKNSRNSHLNLDEKEITEIKNCAYKIFKDSGLKEKNVKIRWYNIKNLKKKVESVNVNNIKSYMRKIVLKKRSKKGASFSTMRNKVEIGSSILSVYHELGHAMNKHIGKLGKIAHVLSLSCLLSIPMLLFSLHDSKTEKTESNNNKTKKLIKNNIGKITFATFIPLLIEEARASIRGLKEAKKIISPNLYNKAVKAGKFGFLSYVTTALFVGFGSYTACKIKDCFTNKKS